MKNKWFIAKQYGWGWSPSTWEGWTVVLLYIGIISVLFLTMDSNSYSVTETLFKFIPAYTIITAMLICICFITGEKPEWRWGDKKVN